MKTNKLYASDCRRATALVCHYGRNDMGGLNALLEEAVEANRVTQLLMAILDLYANVVPVLVTPLGMQCLSGAVVGLTEHAEDDNFKRAARLILKHSLADVPGMNAVLKDAKEASAITPLFLALLDLYGILVPALYTASGLKALQQVVIELAALEDDAE